MQEHWEKTENKLSFKVTAQEPHLSNIFDGFPFCPSERIGGFHIGVSLYIYIIQDRAYLFWNSVFSPAKKGWTRTR